MFLKQYERPSAIIASGVALTRSSDKPYEFEIGLIKKILKDSKGFKSNSKKIKEPNNRVAKTATKGDR